MYTCVFVRVEFNVNDHYITPPFRQLNAAFGGNGRTWPTSSNCVVQILIQWRLKGLFHCNREKTDWKISVCVSALPGSLLTTPMWSCWWCSLSRQRVWWSASPCRRGWTSGSQQRWVPFSFFYVSMWSYSMWVSGVFLQCKYLVDTLYVKEASAKNKKIMQIQNSVVWH